MPSPTLNLRQGKEFFPVRKDSLLKKSGLFQECNSLLTAAEYEVRTPVLPRVLGAFADIIEGWPIDVSEDTCESFRLLSEEFHFEELSAACAEFMASPRLMTASPPNTELLEIPGELGVGSGHCVTINRSRVGPTTYRVLHSRDEIRDFSTALGWATQDRIVIDGIEGKDLIVEKAIEAVYCNTVAAFPESSAKKTFLALAMWKIHEGMLPFGRIDGAIYCLNRLHEIAPTDFEKSKLLVLSQCDAGSPGGLEPLEDADWDIIRNAVTRMREGKNMRREDVREFMQQLKETGKYGRLIWLWDSIEREEQSHSDSDSG
jgi:hypothetical protein